MQSFFLGKAYEESQDTQQLLSTKLLDSAQNNAINTSFRQKSRDWEARQTRTTKRLNV